MKCTLSIDVTDASLDEISRIAEAIKTFNAKQDAKPEPPRLYCDGVVPTDAEDPDDGDLDQLPGRGDGRADFPRRRQDGARVAKSRHPCRAFCASALQRARLLCRRPALTVAEVAQLAKASESQVYKALGRGEIETLNFGKHSPIRISRIVAEAWARMINDEPTAAPSEELPLTNTTNNKEN